MVTRFAPVTAHAQIGHRTVKWLGTAALTVLATGCGSLSGFGGGSSLSCGLPDGVRCESVSATYDEALKQTLPAQRRRAGGLAGRTDAAEDAPGAEGVNASTVRGDVAPRLVAASFQPLRSQSRVARVWIKSWEDADGDLHDQSYVYMPIEEGRWMVDHYQRTTREAFLSQPPVTLGSGVAKSPAKANGTAASSKAIQAQPVKQPAPTGPGGGSAAAVANHQAGAKRAP
ncbi:MAG: TraV family lipoprotein [Burkholderiaceae bacterium]|nr:TraV family lipoprotein [Aquabacterium sp.]NUP85815.1 TraV family lipoprotein [Burkholderiaceae bacterium]